MAFENDSLVSSPADNLSTFKDFLGSSEGADYNVITGEIGRAHV